jgi:hypothetical protein
MVKPARRVIEDLSNHSFYKLKVRPLKNTLS